ncbi:hypothetical protein ACHAW5_001435 [Stephanodiscus triporus]|uniref:Uncharacterized protein n=1 Tax=Stephanodiscus triporus TaxID=2934178 RepID=A0ABD3MVT1_9STRA
MKPTSYAAHDAEGEMEGVEEERSTTTTTTQRSRQKWSKGVADPDGDQRVNVWSLNGFGQPVLTGGMWRPDEELILDRAVRDYCASKNATLTQLCGGSDHRKHDGALRGAWAEIARCLPHRTVLSVYRKALRRHHGLTRGPWTEEEVASLFRLVDVHGRRWRLIQDKLGRSDIDCRNKYDYSNAKFQRGKWSAESVELLLRKVREALGVAPHENEMDVREINRRTLERDTRIPWTAVGQSVNRRREDCYFKWKQMTKRSNRRAAELGLEAVPMARESLKFDVRSEYYRWKAEQNPTRRGECHIHDEVCVSPPLGSEGDDAVDYQKCRIIRLLDSIIDSRATRPSEVSWHALGGDAPREEFEEVIDKYAPDDDLDLPLWKLAQVVRDLVARDAGRSVEPENQKGTKIDRLFGISD